MNLTPDTAPASMNPSAFRTPAVRHLAWLCGAPQLITSAVEFDPGNYLPADVSDRLAAWDRRPDSGPDVLTAPPARRLGHYFERLYETMLRDLLGWEILLKNQPVRRNGITLGELIDLVPAGYACSDSADATSRGSSLRHGCSEPVWGS